MSSVADAEKPKITSKTAEKDIPLKFEIESPKILEDAEDAESEVPSKKVDDLERKIKIIKRIQEIVLRDKGFWLLVACLALETGIYISDCILINKGLKSSSLMSGYFELLKLIISILLGFVFAKIAEK